jgi:hypothetical protein
MNILYGPERLVGPLRTLYESLEMQQGPGTLQSLLVLFELVDVYIDCRQFQAAETTLQDIIGQAILLVRSSRSSTTVSLLCHAHSRISHVRALQDKFLQAEINLRKSRDLSQDELGRDDWEVMSPRTCLWQLISRIQDAAELEK